MGGENGQPARFAVDLAGGPVDAREAHHEIVAQPPGRVVRAPRLDLGEHQPGQVGHLRREQTRDECVVDLDLVLVHATCHGHSVPPGTQERREEYEAMT